jgi:hypothetical protein
LHIGENLKTDEIVKKFESEDSHQIWQATWDIISCNNLDELKSLEPHLPNFRKILSRVEMGGAFRSNAHSAEVAFRYIENTCNEICRCKLYTEEEFLNPRNEERDTFILIENSEVFPNLYEEHFEVVCNGCGKKFKVREIIGGHVPWWNWKKL